MADPLIPVTNTSLKLQKFHVLRAYATPDTNGIIIYNFSFYPASIGVQCTLPVVKRFFIRSIRHCLPDVYFMWCIKCDQFETWNIEEVDMETAAKTPNYCFINALFIHPILFDCNLFSICFNYLCIKTRLAQLCDTKLILLCKSAILQYIVRCDTAYWKHCWRQRVNEWKMVKSGDCRSSYCLIDSKRSVVVCSNYQAFGMTIRLRLMNSWMVTLCHMPVIFRKLRWVMFTLWVSCLWTLLLFLLCYALCANMVYVTALLSVSVCLSVFLDLCTVSDGWTYRPTFFTFC